MSNLETALKSASFSGYVSVREAGLTGMITLRGDFTSAAMKKAVKAATGTAIPDVRQITHVEGLSVAWMSPDELLVLCAYEAADGVIAAFNKAMGSEHGLAVNVSDARAKFQLSGETVREVVAKLAPVDMSTFGVGEIRRTRFAQVAAAMWMVDEQTIEIICFRSVAEYMFNLLKISSEPGYEVGVF